MPRTDLPLVKQIISSFVDVPQPGAREIALHPCDECRELDKAFAPFEFRDIPDEIVASHYNSLPLLSARALHHYLPAYLLYAIAHPDSDVFEFVLYQLSPQKKEEDSATVAYRLERLALFTPEQRSTVLSYLDWATQTDEGQWHAEDIQRAREVWGAAA